MTPEEAFVAAALTEGLLRLLQLRRKRRIASLDAGSGKGHRFLKGGQQPDSMYPSLFGGITTNPEKLEQWCGIWNCKDAAARKRACRVIRNAIATAPQVGDFDDGSSDTYTSSQRAAAAGSFRANASIGCDKWPLREYAMCLKADLDRLGKTLIGGRRSASHLCSTSCI